MRRIHIIASTIGRCGLALRPPVFVSDGNNGDSLDHCSSLNRVSRAIANMEHICGQMERAFDG